MDKLSRFAGGFFRTAIISRGGLHVGMIQDFLDCDNISTGIQQIPWQGTAKLVPRRML
jgi:hypothetical protein